jgi:hypothetical protein
VWSATRNRGDGPAVASIVISDTRLVCATRADGISPSLHAPGHYRLQARLLDEQAGRLCERYLAIRYRPHCASPAGHEPAGDGRESAGRPRMCGQCPISDPRESDSPWAARCARSLSPSADGVPTSLWLVVRSGRPEPDPDRRLRSPQSYRLYGFVSMFIRTA